MSVLGFWSALEPKCVSVRGESSVSLGAGRLTRGPGSVCSTYLSEAFDWATRSDCIRVACDSGLTALLVVLEKLGNAHPGSTWPSTFPVALSDVPTQQMVNCDQPDKEKPLETGVPG